MPVNLREIINFSFVIVGLELLPSDGALRSFQSGVDVEIRRGGGLSVDATTGQSQQARILNLDRDRIILNLSPVRSNVTREFPSISNLETEASRFGHVVDCALNAGLNLKSSRYDFGYNAEMVFDQDVSPTAFQFLGERLLRSEQLALPDSQFVGGSCRMIFVDTLGQWTYNLDSRFQEKQTSRVFINVNLHNAQKPLPDGGQVAEAIIQTIASVQESMNRLGR